MPPRFLPALAWTFVILALCWWPRAYMGIIERPDRPFFVPNIDKLVHLAIFAGFAFLGMRVGPSATRARGVAILLVGVGLAVVTEVVQNTRFVNRDGNVADALADTLGLVVGLIAYARLGRVRTPSPGTP